MTRLVFDHFGEKCFQSPKMSKCVNTKGSKTLVNRQFAYIEKPRHRLPDILR
jgi:hypothetical protein